MENIQINTNSEIDLSLIILNLLCAFVISLLIKFHYKKYSTTLTNRDDFSNLFPFITLTVVLVIYIVKSSLALSLGLVGALSIVRFRTPVKSPIELVFYFVLIVIGISITVAPIYTVLIFSLVSFVPFIFKYIYKLEDGYYEFSENENELSKLSIANFSIKSASTNLTHTITSLEFKLLDFKEDESGNCELSFEVNSLEQYQNLKNQLIKCGKIQKSEFVS